MSNLVEVLLSSAFSNVHCEDVLKTGQAIVKFVESAT